MDRQVENNIIGFLLIVGIAIFYGWSINHKPTTEITYKGKQFILYSLVWEGHTHNGCKQQHKHGRYCSKDLQVYSTVFVPKDQYDREKKISNDN